MRRQHATRGILGSFRKMAIVETAHRQRIIPGGQTGWVPSAKWRLEGDTGLTEHALARCTVEGKMGSFHKSDLMWVRSIAATHIQDIT